jgi:DNA-binding transcriptional LysR family regulator
MELSDLRVFTQVVQSGGVSAAAIKLNRVPSNVTARIKKLEERLGKSLFIRDKNRLRISPTGEQLLPYAKKLLSLAQETLDAVAQKEPNGELRLGSMEAVAATRLVEPVMQYHKTYPQVSLEIKTSPTGDLIGKVIAGELDLALVADPQPDSRLGVKAVFNENLVIVTCKEHRAVRTPEDLADNTTILGFSASCAYRNRLTQWIKQSANVTSVIEINSYHTLLSCVAAGMGVGLVPIALLDYYPFTDSIKIHPLPEQWAASTTHFIWRNDSVKANMLAFIDCVDGNI